MGEGNEDALRSEGPRPGPNLAVQLHLRGPSAPPHDADVLPPPTPGDAAQCLHASFSGRPPGGVARGSDHRRALAVGPLLLGEHSFREPGPARQDTLDPGHVHEVYAEADHVHRERVGRNGDRSTEARAPLGWPLAVAEERGTRIWPVAVALTVAFVVGGLVGYLVGRPSQSPPSRGQLLPGQVRVPNLVGLSARDAERILAPLGLRPRSTRTVSSRQHPSGIVVSQEVRPGSAVRPARAIGLVASSGPGPEPGPRLVFAWSVLIPIDHVGPYRWSSPAIVLAGPPVSLGANTRVIGNAEVSPYQVAPEPGTTGMGMAVSFRVTRFHRPAWFAVLRAFGRQREAAPRSGISVRRTPDGVGLEVEGHCRGAGPQAAPLLVVRAGRWGPGRPVVPLVSLYSFRVRIPLEAVREGGRVSFRVAHTRCASAALSVR